jgi:hypothetical protein
MNLARPNVNTKVGPGPADFTKKREKPHAGSRKSEVKRNTDNKALFYRKN